MDRSEEIRRFFETNPKCTKPSTCDKHIADLFDCSENAARTARYRVFPKSTLRPWEEAERKIEETPVGEGDTWVDGVEKAVPTYREPHGRGRPRLVFKDGYPRTEFPHVCPRDGTVAHTLEEADKLFGWRNVGEFEDGTPKYAVQSWCRKARAEHAASS